MLSAVVAVLCRADLLVILSDIDGFFSKDPRFYKDAELISRIDEINDEIIEAKGFPLWWQTGRIPGFYTR